MKKEDLLEMIQLLEAEDNSICGCDDDAFRCLANDTMEFVKHVKDYLNRDHEFLSNGVEYRAQVILPDKKMYGDINVTNLQSCNEDVVKKLEGNLYGRFYTGGFGDYPSVELDLEERHSTMTSEERYCLGYCKILKIDKVELFEKQTNLL